MSQRNPKKRGKLAKLALAAIAAAGSASWATVESLQTRPALHPGGLVSGPSRQAGNPPNSIKTDDGRQLLWARGPRDVATGEWFDITDSPLAPDGYQYGIGKDSIPPIDQPAFIAIGEREQLRERGIDEATVVIGYVHNGAAKAYPIQILNRHELVNDLIGGKPVTVGW